MPWLRHFAVFLVFVAALFRPAAAGAFVSASDAGSQARVGGFELVAATLVGHASAATRGLHEGIGAEYDENASGYRFAAGGGQRFLRGAKPGQAPDFTPRPNEFKVDPATGTVKPTHGVSVFDNVESVSSRGFVPHEVDQATVPGVLQIKQRGAHEIMPAEGTELTPGQFTTACQGIGCKS